RDHPRTTPIEELVAEGFGTLTPQQSQDSVGKGAYDDGMWKVVIARKMITEDPTDAKFVAGKNTDMAVSVWDGGNREVNGRKAVALWHTLAIEGGSGGTAGDGSAGTGAGTEGTGGGGDGGSGMLIPAIIIGVGAVVAAAIFYASRRKAAPTISK
ncbi:MAG: ethylbenzene dehydrogenase-related protein, partial [Nitrososphaerales archaeon]